MLLFVIYILSVLTSIKGFLFHWVMLSGLAAIVLFIITLSTSYKFEYIDPRETNIYADESGKKYVRWVKNHNGGFDAITFSKLYKQLLDKFKYWLIIPLAIYSLAPNERTQYIMLGTYIGQESIQMIENSKIMQKVGTLIEAKIDNYLLQDDKDLNKLSEKDNKDNKDNKEKK